MKPSLAPLQKHLLSGCTSDMPLANCHRRGCIVTSVIPCFGVFCGVFCGIPGRPRATPEKNSATDRNGTQRTKQWTRSHPEMVGDMSRVTLNFNLSKIPLVHF